MTHRSGLSYSFTSSGPLAKALYDKVGMGIESSLSPDEWLKELASLPLAYAPGERFNYGHSTDVLGFIVGRAAGTNLRDALRRLVFDPLAMTDTDFWIPPTKRDRAAVLYATGPSGKGYVPVEVGGFMGATAPAFTPGGQGLVSTVDDYLTFAQLLLRRGEANGVRLLKSESVELMTRNRLTAEQRKIPMFGGLPMWNSQGFGLGVSMIVDEQAHVAMGAGSAGAFGWPGMFGGWWQADPKQDLILMWLIQVMPGAPAPGVTPRIPGAMALLGFQKQTYAALRN
jgi:CubicO group peptidase (beta-lactamase class C family)